MEDKSAAQQIDAIIKKYADWRGEMLSRLRIVIMQADPAVVEEVKWKKPSRPEGVPVWSHEGNPLRLRYPQERRQVDIPQGYSDQRSAQTL